MNSMRMVAHFRNNHLQRQRIRCFTAGVPLPRPVAKAMPTWEYAMREWPVDVHHPLCTVTAFVRRQCGSLTAMPSPSLVAHRSFSSPATAAAAATSPSSLSQLMKKLRERTGAPMMECKKALQANDNINMDLDKATEYLRRHGTAKISSKVEGRSTTEGMVGLHISKVDGTVGQRAVLLKVASETDFACRSKAFTDLMDGVANAAMTFIGERDSSSHTGGEGASASTTTGIRDTNLIRINMEQDAFLNAPTSFALSSTAVEKDENKKGTVKRLLEDAILSIRENLKIESISIVSSSTYSDGPTTVLSGYVHKRSPHSPMAGRSAALVELKIISSGKCTTEQVEGVGRKLAMHVVAAKPTYLSRTDVPEHILENEKDILREQIVQQSGKKQKAGNIVEKIVDGRLNKFYEEVCLTEQYHMVEKDGNDKVSKIMKDRGLEIVSFHYIAI